MSTVQCAKVLPVPTRYYDFTGQLLSTSGSNVLTNDQSDYSFGEFTLQAALDLRSQLCNRAFGFNAGANVVSRANCIIGSNALTTPLAGQQSGNIIVGSQACQQASVIKNCIALGANALVNFADGANVVSIGSSVALPSGSNNVIVIGSNAANAGFFNPFNAAVKAGPLPVLKNAIVLGNAQSTSLLCKGISSTNKSDRACWYTEPLFNDMLQIKIV